MSVSSKRIEKLLKRDNDGSKISIYIPTHPKTSSQTLSADTNRFKNAIQEIEKHADYDTKELGSTLGKLEKLLDDTEFWRHQDIGLAVFADSEGYECFHLPYETTEAAYLKDSFVVSPLVIMHSIGTTFYVLDVNLTHPRLLISHDQGLIEVDVENMPDAFQDEIAGDEYKPELQYKSAPRDGGQSNRFHGHDVAEEVDKDIAEYLVQIARSVSEYLKDHDQPLLLVGDTNRVGNTRPHISYDNLLEENISGNFEHKSLTELYDLTIEVINKYDSQRRHKLIDALLSADGKNIVVGNDDVGMMAAMSVNMFNGFVNT